MNNIGYNRLSVKLVQTKYQSIIIPVNVVSLDINMIIFVEKNTCFFFFVSVITVKKVAISHSKVNNRSKKHGNCLNRTILIRIQHKRFQHNDVMETIIGKELRQC